MNENTSFRLRYLKFETGVEGDGKTENHNERTGTLEKRENEKTGKRHPTK